MSTAIVVSQQMMFVYSILFNSLRFAADLKTLSEIVHSLCGEELMGILSLLSCGIR